jgi:tetratricopeptide (TPR) repeat protein
VKKMIVFAGATLLVASLAGAQAPAASPAPAPSGRSGAYYHFSLAQQARMAGRFDEALDEYRKAQKDDPTSGAVRAELARLLREGGRLKDAIAEALEGVRIDPKSPEVRLGLAQLYLAQAEAEQSLEPMKLAAQAYEEALKIEPRDAQSMRELSAVYAQLNQHADAARILERYLKDIDPSYADGYLQLSSHRLAQNDAEGAAQALQKAVEIDPSVRAYQNLGDIYRAMQKPALAVGSYQRALELDPQNVQVELKLADALYRTRKLDEALARANTVLEADPVNRYALELKGKALRDLKRYDEAVKLADETLAKAPGDAAAAFLKATVAEARRDYAAAAAELEKLLQRTKENEDAEQRVANDRMFLVHLGLAYQQLDRQAEAADIYGRAFDLSGKTEPGLVAQRVDALVRAKDLDRALAEAREARKRFPDEAQMVTLEAGVLREKGQIDAAVALAEGLRKRSAGKFEPLVEVAEFYQRAKRFGDAEQVLVEARKVDPKDLRALFLLGAVLERQKRHDAAEAVFREALGVEPESAPVLNYLGYMNADRGVRVEEALGLIERALKLDPDNSAYLDSMGWALYRLDRLDQAEQQLRRAVAKGSTNAVVLAHLGDVLGRRGNLSEALDYWRQALSGEDDEGELDRAGVERKIRDAQAGLDDTARRERQ